MVRLGRRLKYAILLLVLLSPSLYFTGVYADTTLSTPSKMSQYTATSGDGNWTVSVTLSYPSSMISGQSVPVTVNVKLKFTQPYVAIYLSQLGIEIRQATVINATTNVVQNWKTLFSNYTSVSKNFTAGATISRSFKAAVAYPLNDSVAAVLTANRKVGINALANFTAYSSAGTSGSTGLQIISVLDDQTIYLNQLGDVTSSLSWAFYQIAAVALTSIVLVRLRTGVAEPADSLYFMKLGSLRLEKALERLDAWLKSERIGETKYASLKEKFDRELEELQRRIRSSSQP